MRHIHMTLLAWLLSAGTVYGLTYVGPPTTNMRAGQWAVGASYGYSEQDIEIDDGAVGDIEDYEIEATLARIAVGLATNRAEVYGLIGGANDEQEEFNGHPETAVGAGARITTNLDDPLSWGLAAQVLYFEPEFGEITDAQVAIGPCWRSEGCLVYGGALLHILQGDIDSDFGGGDFEQDSWLGAYIGGGVDLGRHLTLTVEGQITAGGAGGGTGLMWRF